MTKFPPLSFFLKSLFILYIINTSLLQFLFLAHLPFPNLHSHPDPLPLYFLQKVAGLLGISRNTVHQDAIKLSINPHIKARLDNLLEENGIESKRIRKMPNPTIRHTIRTSSYTTLRHMYKT